MAKKARNLEVLDSKLASGNLGKWVAGAGPHWTIIHRQLFKIEGFTVGIVIFSDAARGKQTSSNLPSFPCFMKSGGGFWQNHPVEK
jgi:hypothetical protein